VKGKFRNQGKNWTVRSGGTGSETERTKVLSKKNSPCQKKCWPKKEGRQGQEPSPRRAGGDEGPERNDLWGKGDVEIAVWQERRKRLKKTARNKKNLPTDTGEALK